MEHKEGHLPGFQKVKIYYQYWLPEGTPKGVLLLVHGLAEHSTRYVNLASYFTAKSYAVCAVDLRGHGKSGGVRGYANKFSDLLADLNTFFYQVRRDFKGLKIFMVGHSIGGTLAVSYTVSHQHEMAGLVLSAPVLKPGASITRRQISMARIISKIFPHLGVARIQAKAICRVPEVVQAYLDDPLVYHGRISARLGAELINTIERDLPPLLPEIKSPLMVLYGSEDRLSNPLGSQYLIENVTSTDITWQSYEGLYHEIFNEPENLQVFDDVNKWVSARL